MMFNKSWLAFSSYFRSMLGIGADAWLALVNKELRESGCYNWRAVWHSIDGSWPIAILLQNGMQYAYFDDTTRVWVRHDSFFDEYAMSWRPLR